MERYRSEKPVEIEGKAVVARVETTGRWTTLLSVEDAAIRAGVDVATITSWMDAGSVETKTYGSVTFVLEDSLEDWLRRDTK